MSGFLDRFGPLGRRRLTIGKALQDLSSFGVKYDDMLIRNSQAIGIIEDQMGYGQMNIYGYSGDDFWYPFAALSMADTGSKKAISFFDQNYVGKREELRDFSLNDEIEDILDTLCDESIVYNDKNFIAYASELEGNYKDEVKKDLNKYYNQIYNDFGFKEAQSAWYYYRKWLIDGFLAFEIIYNDKQDEIIGFKELDPVTLMPSVDKTTNKRIWYQHKDDAVRERKLYDSQVIYISYASISTASRVSYVERLIKAYNILQIMETSRIIWSVMNSSFRMKFIIPVGGKSKTRAQQSLSQLMNNYREVVDYDLKSGALQVNGKPMMGFNREYWMPSKENEEPEIETLGNDGPDLSDTEQLKYFSDKLKLVSKIPFSRFDTDSPATYDMSADGLIREEVKFEKFISRLRSIFKEILVKPLYLQMILKHPELAGDINFKNQVSIVFNADNMFAELKEMEIVQKRVDFISSVMSSLSEQDENMNEIPYIPLELLVDKYMKLDPNFKEEIEEYKKKKKDEKPDDEDIFGDDDDDLGLGI